MKNYDEETERFSEAMYELIKDQSDEFKEAVVWFADNIEEFDYLFDNDTHHTEEEYKTHIRHYVEIKNFQIALLLVYKMIHDQEAYEKEKKTPNLKS